MYVDAFDASTLCNGVVSVRCLCVQNPPSFLALSAEARRCLSLAEMQMYEPLDAGDVEALLDFALNKPLTALSLSGSVTPAALPLLTRVLSGKILTTLDMWINGHVLTPSPAFCDAIAAAPIVRLSYVECGLFVDLDAGLSLLAAVTRHPTLRHLDLFGNHVAPAGNTAVGAALGLLVALDSPLSTLDIWNCKLENDGLLPFIDALPRNTHIRGLKCAGNDFTQLAVARLLAAVRANASLIDLYANDEGDEPTFPELVEAEVLVAARAT